VLLDLAPRSGRISAQQLVESPEPFFDPCPVDFCRGRRYCSTKPLELLIQLSQPLLPDADLITQKRGRNVLFDDKGDQVRELSLDEPPLVCEGLDLPGCRFLESLERLIRAIRYACFSALAVGRASSKYSSTPPYSTIAACRETAGTVLPSIAPHPTWRPAHRAGQLHLYALNLLGSASRPKGGWAARGAPETSTGGKMALNGLTTVDRSRVGELPIKIEDLLA
jgi:hypothetical protein